MLKLIKNFTKKEWILALICLVLVVTQVWLELKMPDYMSEITKLVQTEGSQMKDILVNGGYMLTCSSNYRIYNIKNIIKLFKDN